jgi:hypothetical protein
MDQVVCGAPGEIRTPDPLVRSQVLYPTELRAHGMKLLRGAGWCWRGVGRKEPRILRADVGSVHTNAPVAVGRGPAAQRCGAVGRV